MVIVLFSEWEYTGNVRGEELDDPPKTDKEQSNIEHVPFTTYPSRRLGMGTWKDAKGYWWVFGGLAAASVTSDILNKTSSPTHYLRTFGYMVLLHYLNRRKREKITGEMFIAQKILGKVLYRHIQRCFFLPYVVVKKVVIFPYFVVKLQNLQNHPRE